MLCVDVNILVDAHRPESPRHSHVRPWLEAALIAREPVGLIDSVLQGYLRIVTHPRVFATPTPIDHALDDVQRLRRAPSTVDVVRGERFWDVFQDLCRSSGATGNRVPDAAIAAIAIEAGASLVTADRGFARYSGLRVLDPFGS